MYLPESPYTDVVQSPTYDRYAEKIFRNGGIIRDISGNILNIITDDEFDVNSSTNELSFYDINTKLIFKPGPKDKLSLSSLFTRTGIDFSFTSDGETRVDSIVTHNNGLSLSWEHTDLNNRKTEMSAYFSNYQSYYNKCRACRWCIRRNKHQGECDF